ncbi:MAG: hypothetical protein Q8M07_10165 [Prosthecobacter sp.]|nr:hypothetical protein [Prosthecobacter sp.]
MISIGRLVFALTACLLLNSCGLIGTALRLAPYLLMVEEDGKGGPAQNGPQQRGRLIEDRGDFQPAHPMRTGTTQQMAAR